MFSTGATEIENSNEIAILKQNALYFVISNVSQLVIETIL
jgi:hypothetical protein